MSNNEISEMEMEDQSEDGELVKTPRRKRSPLHLSKEVMDSYGFSDDDAEDTPDSLDIKPPQAKVYHHKSSRSTSKREKHNERSSSSRREHIHTVKSESHRKSHHRSREHRERHEERIRDKHHHRDKREHGRHVVERGERGERVLEDLRERLLDKRRSENERRIKIERTRERDRDRHLEEEPSHMLPSIPRETPREKEERMEKEMRRDRLLEADREMSRQKDVYRRELAARRERQHLEKEKERIRALSKKRDRSHSREHNKKFRADDVDRNKNVESEGVSYLGRLKDELSQQVVIVSDSEEHSISNEDDDDDEKEEEEEDEDDEDIEEEEEEEEDREDEDNEDEDVDDRHLNNIQNSENSKCARNEVQIHSSDKDPDNDCDEENEVSSSAEEEDDSEDSGSSSRTDKDGNSEESLRHNSDEGRESYSNHVSPSVPVDHHSPELDNNEINNSADQLDISDEQEKQVDKNGADFINDESPKSDIISPDSLPPYFPAIQGCRNMEEFQCLNKIEEGTYGVVFRGKDKRTKEIVALKRLKMEKEKEGFPITSLREINTLLKAQHPNIVTVREIVVGSHMDKIYIVMDYVEHDLKSLMETMREKKQCFIPGEVKCLMRQLLRAVAHLHDNWILHRDLKTSNLLLSHKGILKVGDFGLAREYGSPLKAYTPVVVTLWYRAPELLLCTKEYSTPIDMWSVGCIFGEFLSMEPLFTGKSEVEQLNRIFKDLGTPNERIWPGFNKLPFAQKAFIKYPVNQLRQRFGTIITDSGMDLMNGFLTYDPTQRITAEIALKHSYFEEAPLPIDPSMFPTWPAKSETTHRKVTAASPKAPQGGHEYKQLDDDEIPTGRFHMGALEKSRAAVGAGFRLKF